MVPYLIICLAHVYCNSIVWYLTYILKCFRKLSWMRKLFLKPCHLLTLMTSPSSGLGKAGRWRVDQITSSLWTKGSTLVKYPRTSSSASKCTTA